MTIDRIHLLLKTNQINILKNESNLIESLSRDQICDLIKNDNFHNLENLFTYDIVKSCSRSIVDIDVLTVIFLESNNSKMLKTCRKHLTHYGYKFNIYGQKLPHSTSGDFIDMIIPLKKYFN